MKMNKGEWSEIYTFLKILDNPSLEICCEDLVTKLDEYEAKEIYRVSKTDNELIFILENEKVMLNSNIINKTEIEETLNTTYKEILKGSKTFEILIATKFSSKFDFKLKAPSQSKSDIDIKILDKEKRIKRLGYSIKSKLGSPATLLNASNQTNFKYVITGLKDEDVTIINSISSRTKLKDRYNKIIELGGTIKFDTITSQQFKSNLRILDGDLENILGELLLNSYIIGDKNLSKLLELSTNQNNLNVENPELFYKCKYSKILEAITFGMIPGKEYNPISLDSMGGIIVVLENGDIKLLDKVYYQETIRKYLLKNLKLDSPSSSRYHMLELSKENEKISFTLNLQIRFK